MNPCFFETTDVKVKSVLVKVKVAGYFNMAISRVIVLEMVVMFAESHGSE